MKKLTLISALCGLFGFGAVSVHATPYWDHDVIGTTLSAGESFTGSFDIATGDGDPWDYSGYDSSNDSLISGFATITLLNLSQTLGEARLNIPLSNNTQIIAYMLPVFHSSPIGGQLLLDLSNAGMITYTVKNTGASAFTVVGATMDVMSVPDGASTVGLLGLGLVVTALVGRRSRLRRRVA